MIYNEVQQIRKHIEEIMEILKIPVTESNKDTLIQLFIDKVVDI